MKTHEERRVSSSVGEIKNFGELHFLANQHPIIVSSQLQTLVFLFDNAIHSPDVATSCAILPSREVVIAALPLLNEHVKKQYQQHLSTTGEEHCFFTVGPYDVIATASFDKILRDDKEGVDLDVINYVHENKGDFRSQKRGILVTCNDWINKKGTIKIVTFTKPPRLALHSQTIHNVPQ